MEGIGMRILVAIANYGFKNIEYLKKLIQEYKSMPCDTDIIILSNVPKKLEGNVEVVVGFPTKDPWSLPFGHKRIFAERIDNYDLFVYSEDDILITWKNIESFLMLSEVLPDGDIAGFMRYEMDSTGKRWYPDFLGPYHWLPNSIKKVDKYTFAAFSNIHSACYVLTQNQLKRVISSGGYLVEPHKGRYDLLCSAATDPYTQCGLRKLICISHISDFVVHHLPNRYANVWGINEDDFQKQIDFMFSLENSERYGQELVPIEKKINHIRWDKMYYDLYDSTLLSLLSPKAKKVLSIGCGYASNEAVLVKKGLEVTAIPLDIIIGVLATSKEIRVMEPDFEKAFSMLDGTMFDCIIFSDVLQHLRDPVDMLSRATKLLANDGEIIVNVPNFYNVKFFKDHFPYPILKRWTYRKNLLHVVTKKHLKRWFQSSGIKMSKVQYAAESRFLKKRSLSLGILNALLASRIYAVGKISSLKTG